MHGLIHLFEFAKAFRAFRMPAGRPGNDRLNFRHPAFDAGGKTDRAVQAGGYVGRLGADIRINLPFAGGVNPEYLSAAVGVDLIAIVDQGARAVPENRQLGHQQNRPVRKRQGRDQKHQLILFHRAGHLDFNAVPAQPETGIGTVIRVLIGKDGRVLLVLVAHVRFLKVGGFSGILQAEVDGKTLRKMDMREDAPGVPGIPSAQHRFFHLLIFQRTVR